MLHHTPQRKRLRRGAIAVLTALMMTFLVGLLAFAIDYGCLVKVRIDLQRAADAAALAAVQDLVPAANGTQNLDLTRWTTRAYTRRNLEDPYFQIAEADIEIGRFDPDTIYSNVTLLPSGTFDAVRVTLRRDGVSNPLVNLFFARVLGHRQSDVVASATAVLQKAECMLPGADVLPFATPVGLWDSLHAGESWSLYGDGRLTDAYGHVVSGNWGTLDIGGADNSTSDLNDQILHGLRQSDLDILSAENRIPDNVSLDSSRPVWTNGDPGLSVGVKSSVLAIHGQKRLVPLYDEMSGSLTGGNLEFHIVGWGVVTVVSSEWKGEVNSRVIVRKCYGFFGELRPKGNLGSGTSYIEGAYTSPVLVQ